MTANFLFDINPVQNLVRITMSGFFAADDIVGFAAAQREAYQQLRCPPNQHVTLVDMRAMQIQSQSSVVHFQKLMSDPAVASRRIAFVVARSLARMQIKRATTGLQAALFMTHEEAEQWLTQEQPSEV